MEGRRSPECPHEPRPWRRHYLDALIAGGATKAASGQRARSPPPGRSFHTRCPGAENLDANRPVDHVLLACRGAGLGPRHHQRLHGLAAVGVLRTDHAGLQHHRALEQQQLHLGGPHLEARPDR